MTRTHMKHLRAYINGVDLSGYSRTMGALAWMFGAEPDAAWTDETKNIVPGQSDITAGALNTILDNDAAGAFNLLNAGNGLRLLTLAVGVNAAPAAGNPMFAWQFEQTSYAMEPGTGFVSANVPFVASHASNIAYKKPWGFLLHAKGAETGANTATGQDDSGASSALGGLFVYHLFSSDGTVTLKAQHASTNLDGSFADLTLATSGSIDASVTPAYGMVSLATNLTINRYTRWQLALGTATTATFVMGLIRNTVG